MKTPRAALITILLSAACTQAYAVPIVFEFTGTITGRDTQVLSGEFFRDDKQYGVAYWASLTIDTGLRRARPVHDDYGYSRVPEYGESEFLQPAVQGTLKLGVEIID